MNRSQIENAIEKNNGIIYIISSVGNPENDCYEPLKLRIRSVDWDKEVVRLSFPDRFEICDRSSFDEIYSTEEETWIAIKEI